MSSKEKTSPTQKNANIFLFIIVILIILIFILVIRSYQYPLYSILFFPTIAAILFIIRKRLIRWYSNWKKGAKGEDSVKKELKKLGNEYFVTHNIYLPKKEDDIDHIAIGKNGIFVIETKNYSGKICSDGDEWYGFYEGRWQRTDKNPGKQVKGNALALRDFLQQKYPKLSNIWIEPIVVFTNKKTLVTTINPTVTVKKIEELNDFIKRYSNDIKIDLSPDDFVNLKTIFNELKSKKK
jgi:hypothetical protein